MGLCCLALQFHLAVPLQLLVKSGWMAPHISERSKEPTPACSCHQLFGHHVLSNTIHLLHSLKLLHIISLCNTFNSAF